MVALEFFHAVDILFIAPTVQNMHVNVNSSNKIMVPVINFMKSCFLQIGPRCDAVCTGSVISAWSSVLKMRYLGVYFYSISIIRYSLRNDVFI